MAEISAAHERAPSGAQTLLRVKRPREAPSLPLITVFNDAPARAQRVSMAQLQLKHKNGDGPTVRNYRLLVPGGALATRAPPSHHTAIISASKASFAASERSRQVHDKRAQSFRYRCVQERRMAASDARERFGNGLAALDERQVRLLDLEMKPVGAAGSRSVAFVPFGPPVPSAAAEREMAEQQAMAETAGAGAGAYEYDVYMADDACAQPSSDAVVYIEYPDDDEADDEFRSDETNSDLSTDDSNAEGHFANDYPDSEHSSSSEERNARIDGFDDDRDDPSDLVSSAGLAFRGVMLRTLPRRHDDSSIDSDGVDAKDGLALPLVPGAHTAEKSASSGSIDMSSDSGEEACGETSAAAVDAVSLPSWQQHL